MTDSQPRVDYARGSGNPAWLKDNAPVEFRHIFAYQDAHSDKISRRIINDAGEFWSNNDGWGDESSKTLFYPHEKLTVSLPIGGQWSLVG